MPDDLAHQIAAVFAEAEDLAAQVRAAYAEVDALLARWRAAGGTYDRLAAEIVAVTGREQTADEMRRVVDVLRQRHRRHQRHDTCHTPVLDSAADRRHRRHVADGNREGKLIERITERTIERYEPVLDDLADGAALSRSAVTPTPSAPASVPNSPSVPATTGTEGE